MNKLIIDADNAILGRLASYAAKQSLLGMEITIVNCNKSVIAGKKSSIIKEYIVARQRGGSSRKGPFFPKTPARILKRTIRGMLTYKKGRGEDAYKRIKCYDTTPDELKDAKKILAGKEKKIKTLKLNELSKEI
jgi:large subunit ribosomal protein L13